MGQFVSLVVFSFSDKINYGGFCLWEKAHLGVCVCPCVKCVFTYSCNTVTTMRTNVSIHTSSWVHWLQLMQDWEIMLKQQNQTDVFKRWDYNQGSRLQSFRVKNDPFSFLFKIKLGQLWRAIWKEPRGWTAAAFLPSIKKKKKNLTVQQQYFITLQYVIVSLSCFSALPGQRHWSSWMVFVPVVRQHQVPNSMDSPSVCEPPSSTPSGFQMCSSVHSRPNR